MSPTSQAVDGARVSSASTSPGACGRADDDLVALEHSHRGTVAAEQLDGVPHRLVEDVVRVELAGEIAAGPREALRQLPGAPLPLVEIAALERAARGRRHVRRQLELRVVEGALALEEDEHEAGTFAAGLLERDGQERASVGRRSGRSKPRTEAIVLAEPPGCEHLAAARTEGQCRRGFAEVRREPVRELVGAGELEPGAGGAEHGGRVTAERLRGGLCDRIQRLLLGEGLTQDSRDPVEAALDVRLPSALLVRLGIPERDRREAREGLDQGQVGLLEAAGVARADAEHAADLAEREDRRFHHLGEARVAVGGRRLLGLAEVASQHGLAGRDRVADRAGDRDRPADLVLGQPEHGAADKLVAAGEQRPAVGGVGVDERAKLVDEALDHGVEAEVARERLPGLQQRLLLGQPAVALAQQARGVERDRSLAGDGLRERDLVRAPVTDGGPMEREHAEEPLMRDDRRRQYGTNAVLGEAADVTEAAVVERRRLEDVGDGHRAAKPGGEIRDRQPAGIAERRHTDGVPLGRDPGRVVLLAEPDEAAGRVDRDADLLEHRRQHLGDVPARPELERHVRDQALPLERVGESDRRARPLEREPRLADERLHPPELLLVEHARAANRPEDDGDHLVPDANRHVDAALGLRDRVQALVDHGRVLGVVDRERRPLAHGGVDPGRLPVERDPLADEAGVIPAALAGGDDHGGQPVVLDQRQVGEVELEGAGQLVQQHLRDVGRLGRVEQLLRQPRAHRLALGGCVLPRRPAAIPPQEGRKREADDGQRQRRDREQRRRVEQHRLSLRVHWALSMIETRILL